MSLETSNNYGLTVTKTEKLNYHTVKGDPKNLKLHDPHKFDKRFEEMTRLHDTYEEAYHAVEEQYRSIFGETKYSNFESYYRARRRRIKKKMARNEG